jgi:hypothetical protein
MAQLRMDRTDLRRVIRGAARQELRQVAPRVVTRAKILAPVDTGRMRAAIGPPQYSRHWLRPKATIEVNIEYADFVHGGTRPHVIRPRHAQLLRFVVDGQVVYARVVHHPGTRPRPFLDRALRQVTEGRGYAIRER